MTVQELKDLLDQLPPERMNNRIIVAIGRQEEKVEPDLSQAVQQVQSGLGDKDEFHYEWRIYESTAKPIVGMSLEYTEEIVLIRD